MPLFLSAFLVFNTQIATSVSLSLSVSLGHIFLPRACCLAPNTVIRLSEADDDLYDDIDVAAYKGRGNDGYSAERFGRFSRKNVGTSKVASSDLHHMQRSQRGTKVEAPPASVMVCFLGFPKDQHAKQSYTSFRAEKITNSLTHFACIDFSDFLCIGMVFFNPMLLLFLFQHVQRDT